MSVSRTTELHRMQVHIFHSEQEHAQARAEGAIGENDLVLTPDTGVTTYENMEAATERAEAIAHTLEESLANNAFMGPAGPQGEPGTEGPAGPAGQDAVSETYTVTLAQSGWADREQTVSLPQIGSEDRIMVSAAPTDVSAYAAAGIYAYALGEGTVSFRCDVLPAQDLAVHILLLH